MTQIGGVLLLALVTASQVPPPRDNGEIGRRLRAEWRAILDQESAALDRIAEGLTPADAAALLTLKAPKPSPDGSILFIPLPESIPAPGRGLANRPTDAAIASPEVRAAREKAARDLFRLAARAALPENARYDVAGGCVRDVIARDPGSKEARRLLGYVAHNGGWATPHAAQNAKDGLVLDATFGWVPTDWVPHLQKGELPGLIVRGRPVPWLPAAEADALRDTIARGWTIKTEHFDIRTNVPLAEAVAFGRRLEALDDAFFLFFGDLIGDDLPLARRFRDPKLWASTRDGKRHSVLYFATKEEYVEYLRPREGPSVENSLGTYIPPKKGQPSTAGRSYFFRDKDGQIDVLSTLFHESSHQLLFESAGASRHDQNIGQYWVWEGLGTYFETFTPQDDGTYRLGGLVGPRIAKARDDILGQGLLVPIAELAAMDKARFNDDRDVYLHYAESMALTVFLMHHDGGRYRDDFLDYVTDAYRGRFRRGGSGQPLAERLEIDPKALDAEFISYLKPTAPPGP